MVTGKTSEYGHNASNWIILSQAPKPDFNQGMEKVQRIDGDGQEGFG